MKTLKKTLIMATLVMSFGAAALAADDRRATGTGQSVNCPAINTSQEAKPADNVPSQQQQQNGASTAGQGN